MAECDVRLEGESEHDVRLESCSLKVECDVRWDMHCWRAESGVRLEIY